MQEDWKVNPFIVNEITNGDRMVKDIDCVSAEKCSIMLYPEDAGSL